MNKKVSYEADFRELVLGLDLKSRKARAEGINRLAKALGLETKDLFLNRSGRPLSAYQVEIRGGDSYMATRQEVAKLVGKPASTITCYLSLNGGAKNFLVDDQVVTIRRVVTNVGTTKHGDTLKAAGAWHPVNLP